MVHYNEDGCFQLEVIQQQNQWTDKIRDGKGQAEDVGGQKKGIFTWAQTHQEET